MPETREAQFLALAEELIKKNEHRQTNAPENLRFEMLAPEVASAMRVIQAARDVLSTKAMNQTVPYLTSDELGAALRAWDGEV